MTTPSKPFIDKALAAIDALRIFAHNVQLEEATFKSQTFSTGTTFREVIDYRSTQCWGEVTRTTSKLTIRVIPIMGKGDDFKARGLVFPKTHYAESTIFTASSDELLANDGKDFCLKIAELFATHSPDRFSAIPYYNGGDRLIMIGPRSQDDLEHSQDIDLMAAGLRAILDENESTAKAGMAIYIQHPAFDMPGVARLIDASDRIHPVEAGKFAERFKAVDEGTRHLIPSLMFDNIGDEYPVSFEVTPLRFTIATPEDRSQAKTRGMIAAQRIAVRAKVRAGTAMNDLDEEGSSPNF